MKSGWVLLARIEFTLSSCSAPYSGKPVRVSDRRNFAGWGRLAFLLQDLLHPPRLPHSSALFFAAGSHGCGGAKRRLVTALCVLPAELLVCAGGNVRHQGARHHLVAGGR